MEKIINTYHNNKKQNTSLAHDVYVVELRTTDFPTSLAGKGHDTAVCCRWMEHFLRSIEAWHCYPIISNHWEITSYMYIRNLWEIGWGLQHRHPSDYAVCDLQCQFGVWHPLCTWNLHSPKWSCQSNSKCFWYWSLLPASGYFHQCYIHQDIYCKCSPPTVSLLSFSYAKVGYAQLASMAKAENLKLFKLRPKLHMWFEVFIGMQTNSITLSPLATATWSDEDYIGRVSRVGRSAHGAVVSISCMRKALGMYKRQFQQLMQRRRAA